MATAEIQQTAVLQKADTAIMSGDVICGIPVEFLDMDRSDLPNVFFSQETETLLERMQKPGLLKIFDPQLSKTCHFEVMETTIDGFKPSILSFGVSNYGYPNGTGQNQDKHPVLRMRDLVHYQLEAAKIAEGRFPIIITHWNNEKEGDATAYRKPSAKKPGDRPNENTMRFNKRANEIASSLRTQYGIRNILMNPDYDLQKVQDYLSARATWCSGTYEALGFELKEVLIAGDHIFAMYDAENTEYPKDIIDQWLDIYDPEVKQYAANELERNLARRVSKQEFEAILENRQELKNALNELGYLSLIEP